MAEKKQGKGRNNPTVEIVNSSLIHRNKDGKNFLEGSVTLQFENTDAVDLLFEVNDNFGGEPQSLRVNTPGDYLARFSCPVDSGAAHVRLGLQMWRADKNTDRILSIGEIEIPELKPSYAEQWGSYEDWIFSIPSRIKKWLASWRQEKGVVRCYEASEGENDHE